MAEMKSIGKYLQVELLDDTKKTKRWQLQSVNGGVLGSIHWYGAWRQYCFFPSDSTLFNCDCLYDIMAFLRECNKAQRADRKAGER